MTIIHDRKYFYKYVTAEAALLILQSRKLKHSSPFIFNDPFDVQTRIVVRFEESEFAELYIKELYRLTHDEKDPCLDATVPLVSSIQLIRQVVKNSPTEMSRDQWMEAIKDIAMKRYVQLLGSMNEWWSQVGRASRIFCVVEEPDNLLMWAHYGQNHEGAVIQFECLPELDNPLCAAMKVNYVTDPPVIAKTPDDYIRYLTGQPPTVNHESLFYDLYLSKSVHWKYENEWRVFIPPNLLNPIVPKDAYGNEILFDLISFFPQEIHSIYFGCKMSEDNRQKIETCLSGDFEHVKKYNCIRNQKKYKLDFAEIIR
jgi:hypothetical protein